ncbi:p-loop containing nucleoside triphosphate hydrolase [Venturia nashicola]|uniref:p-loop containing nucleoside triphosphate hydrolase n=1 Tax=Venturia nashicola TaxID=86259 RepID=A0A4Z1NX25_9PEZI|nr:p-loop containing nucleoside triphosphate hydrolase [Venturia nashicola]
MALFPPGGSHQEREFNEELKIFGKFLGNEGLVQSSDAQKILQEELKMTPLFSMSIKQAALKQGIVDFGQYAVLGHVIPMTFDGSINNLATKLSGVSLDEPQSESNNTIDPVLLNTNTPWSAFICGSQGSGKSHTMSCILENCLLPDAQIGKLAYPLAGLVFHYDSMDSSHCEAAHLCSQGIQVKVLVSPSNYQTLKTKYGTLPGAEKHLKVQQLWLHGSHLNTERIKRLMAFGDDSEQPPLYLQASRLPPLS